MLERRLQSLGNGTKPGRGEVRYAKNAFHFEYTNLEHLDYWGHWKWLFSSDGPAVFWLVHIISQAVLPTKAHR